MVKTTSWLSVVFGTIIRGLFSYALWIRYSLAICALEGSSVNISCGEITQNGSWGNGKILSDPLDPLHKDRVYVHYDGHRYILQFKNLSKSDAKTDYCRTLLNEKFQQTKQEVKLFVTGLRLIVDAFPDNLMILKCDTTCKLDGNVSFIWMWNGMESSRSNSQYLRLNFSKNAEGNYSCAVSGHQISSPVENLYLPRNTSVLINIAGVTDGDNVSLNCNSDANPPVKSYTWFKVNQSSPVGSGQQFNITGVRSEDEGLYYCEAKNLYGAKNSSTVSLTVADKSLVNSLYAITGVTACGVVGLLALLCYIRHFKTNVGKGDVKSHARTTAQTDVPDDQYASVQFKKAEIASNLPEPQQEEPSVIYSSVHCRA